MNRRISVAVTMTVGAVALVGCSSSASTPQMAPSTVTVSSAPTPAADQALAASVAKTKWWQPGADYCQLLKQTLAAGHSILPGAGADDPTLHAVTEDFLTDLQHAAPSAIAPSWHVLGNLIISLVRANGDASAVTGVDPGQVRAAVHTVSTDASARCGVDLAAAGH